MVNNDADIFTSDEDERAEIDRNPDGSVVFKLENGERLMAGVYLERKAAPALSLNALSFEERLSPSTIDVPGSSSARAQEVAERGVQGHRTSSRRFLPGSMAP